MLAEERVRLWLEQRMLEPEQLRRIRAETIAEGLSAEQIFVSQVALLDSLIQATCPQSVLELGTYMGYSTAALALAISDSGGGSILTVERDGALAAKAARLVPTMPNVTVSYATGDAAHVCVQLKAEGTSFDLIFLDIAEIEYPRLIPLCIDLLRNRGLLIIDNVLMATVAGWQDGSNVLDGEGQVVEKLRNAVDLLMADRRLKCAIIPLGSGFAICTKRVNHG